MKGRGGVGGVSSQPNSRKLGDCLVRYTTEGTTGKAEDHLGQKTVRKKARELFNKELEKQKEAFRGETPGSNRQTPWG